MIQTHNNYRGLHNISQELPEITEIQHPEQETPPVPSYHFTHPTLAYKVLNELDILNTTGSRYTGKLERAVPYLHLKTDDNYCKKHREYITKFPEVIFNQINFITDMGPKTFPRGKVIPDVGNDIQPNIGTHISHRKKEVFDIGLEATYFFTRNEFYHQKRIGQHFSCLSQISNLIPSKQVLDQKNQFVEAVKEYAKQYEDRPECFNFNKFFPDTYLLYRKEECLGFFAIFNSPQYQVLKEERKIVYIKKLGANIHNGEGVNPVTEEQEQELRTLYANGTKCGEVTTKIFVQNFIHNPLLLNGRKFDFRIYLLFASTNPLMAYYHDGFLRVSLETYDPNSNDKKALLTNLALNKQVYMNAKNGILYKDMNEEELRDSQQWSFERLQTYLLEANIISDPNWLDNYLRPEFKKAFAHLLRFTMRAMYEHSSVYQLYGVDFMLDDNLNVWFIEANSKPGLGGYSETVEKMMIKMLQDQIELVTGLLRSRMKRVVRYVNLLIEKGEVKDHGVQRVSIKDLEEKKRVFKEISKNYFEKEFEPSAENGFSKVVDGNYDGVERYQGYIEKECL